MTDGRLQGRFWLPGRHDQAVGGWLDLCGRWPHVELADPRTDIKLVVSGDGGYIRSSTGR